ncbi:MAG: hypothetical protein IKW84_04150 [Bacteroidaceae bacterium]|nr:hypothetical protein [Bacteroidaceae bacterium]
MSSENLPGKSNNTLAETAKDCLTSGNPVKIIGGIAIGVIAIGGMAIGAIAKLSGKNG